MNSLSDGMIYANQTAMLRWLRSLGHDIEFARDYKGAPLRREEQQIPPPVVPAPVPSSTLLKTHAGKPCPYCGSEMTAADAKRHPTRDHKHPKSRGGKRGRNQLICCRRCNENKGDRTLDEWHLRLTTGRDPRADRVGWILLDEIKGRGAPAAPAEAPARKGEDR